VAASLAELLSALAARTPAPGGGSAAAWSGALAAALLQMAAAFAGAEQAAARAAILRRQLLDGAESDSRSYEPVLSALRLPASDPTRAHRLAAARSSASEAPVAMARGAAEVAELAADVASRSKPDLRGDAVMAVLLAEAATRGAAELVAINLRDLDDDPRVGEVQRLSGRAAAARARVVGER
jgi:methenyltetrahydrofolate cyclohydrolase